MCFDQEKTQAPKPLFDRAAVRDVRGAKDSFADRIEQCGGQIGRAISPAEILSELFSYHPPTEVTLPKFAAINQAAKNFAEVVLQNCPSSVDRSRVIEMIRDARMVANASVALNGLSL